MDTTVIGGIAEILLADSGDVVAQPEAEERLYMETCRVYGFAPGRMPARLRAPFLRTLGVYVKNGRTPTHGELLCLYLGVRVAAREYEGR